MNVEKQLEITTRKFAIEFYRIFFSKIEQKLEN